MNSVLTIGGTPYTAAQRAAAQIELDSWGWDLDSDLSAEFHETRVGSMVPRFHCGQLVSITVDSGSGAVTRFTGEIATVVPTFAATGWTFGYRCMGPKYQASGTYCTNVDLTGLIVYNLAPDDQEYIPANSGLSVGTIIIDVLTLHATALSALGITTDATTTTQLNALTVVPNEPVYLSGRVFDAMEGLLQRWARNVKCQVTPAGLVRFWDTTAGSAIGLTLGTDPVDPPCFSRDVRSCSSRLIVRGKGKIYPAYVSLGRNSLTAAWSGAQQTAWKYTDFSQPNDAYDKGTILSVDSPTQATIQSAVGTEAFGVNFWNAREAWMYLSSSIGTGLTYTESRPVTANTAMTAGGTAAITLGFPLENASLHAYNQYQLIGKVDPLTGSSSNNRNNVYRLFNVTDPGRLIADHMVAKFPVQVPFMNYSGTAESLTWYPEAAIVKGLATWPATFKLMPLTGQILFDEPCVKALNSPTVLNTGGGGVAVPDDIYCLLAYSRGALTSTYPPDIGGLPQYAGTSYTADGIQFTQTVDVESWVYQGNQSLMDAYAQMLWQSMSDTVVTGSVSYKGAWTAAFAPNLKLNISGAGFMTDMESLGVPIRSFTLRYHADGKGGLNYSSQAQVSSRRNPRTGDTLFLHTTQLSQVGFKLDFAGSLNMGGMGAAGAASWAASGSAADLAAGASAGMGGLAGGAAEAMGGITAGMADQMSGAAGAASGALGGPTGDQGGDTGDMGAGGGYGGPTGIPRGRKKKGLGREEARKKWQAKAQGRVQPKPPVSAEDVANTVGTDYVSDVGGIEDEGNAPADDGKPHSFTGIAPPKSQDATTRMNRGKLQPRPISRQQAINQSSQAAKKAMEGRRQQKRSAMEKRAERRDRADEAGGHPEITGRHDDDTAPDSGIAGDTEGTGDES